MKIKFTLLLSLLCTIVIIGYTQPTNNPYTSKYGLANNWTDSLKWSTVTNATTASTPVTTSNNATVNTANLRSLIATVSTSGGGVIYFPAGDYSFNDSIMMKTGVILRGETPSMGNAKATGYNPGTNFNFPQYIPTFTGTGTDNKTAFKFIGGEPNAFNIGLINLDINRAGIAIHPIAYVSTPNKTVGGTTQLPIDINRNILIYGVRSNNVVMPEPTVPTAAMRTAGGGWQRFVWRFTSNIDVFVSKNGVISNCRLNDAPTDSYDQPGYLPTTGTCARGAVTASASDFKFNVTNHYGVSLNRAKINKDGPRTENNATGTNSPYGIYRFNTYAQPEDEPQLFVTGNVVRDCWIFKTMRIGLTAAGNGLLIKGNEVSDEPNKIAWLNANGNNCNVTGATTLENRGIDFSGWNVTVDSNTTQAYRHSSRGDGYFTTDGEGVLLQECCGGTAMNGYKITNNSTSTYIGLYKMRDFNNVLVKGNNLNGSNLFLQANTNSSCGGGNETYYSLNNVIVEDNINVSEILFRGSKGGSGNIVRNNKGTGSSKMDLTWCAVTLEKNNSGFSTIIYRPFDETINCGTIAALDSNAAPVCTPSTISPKIDFVGLNADTNITTASPSYVITTKLSQGIIANNRVTIYVNGVAVLSNVRPDAQRMVSYTYTFPSTGTYDITSKTRDSVLNLTVFSPIRKINYVMTLGFDNVVSGKVLSVYPNPISGQNEVFVTFNNADETRKIQLLSINGSLLSTTSSSDSKVSISTSGLNPGVYLVKVNSATISKTFKIVVLN